MPQRKKNLLIITSSGGGGHLQAANAKISEVLARNPQINIVKRDFLLNWTGKYFGKFCTHLYDSAMKTGKVHVQERLVKMQCILDAFGWPFIFFHVFGDLMRHDIDEVIDTQPLGTSAIIKAIRLASFFTKKPITLEKIITELPTENVTHFFKPIKNLSEKDRAILRLFSARPLDQQQSTQDFWETNCNLSENKITYDLLPLRPTFYRFTNQKPHTEPLSIPIHFTNEVEKNLILEAIARGHAKKEIQPSHIQFTIEPEDNLLTLMLGSRPAEKATLKYVENFIEICRNSDKQNYLFVFCGNHHNKGKSLLKRVHDLVLMAKDYPQNLTIVPIPFQDDSVIAPLFSRSNATFTRSGGLTSMELMSVAQGQIWIHSEINKHIQRFRKKHSESMLTGMLGWEQGNAFYLQCVKGAKIISPETFTQSLKNLL